MELYAAHVDGLRTVHLTARSFLVEALCGESVMLDGEPDVAVICDECDRVARDAGGDPESWVSVPVTQIELRAAA